MAKPELGTKRVDPETGQKFFDLNKDPIVSPYTGKTYPRTYFESTGDKLVEDDVEETEKDEAETDDSAPEVISLEEADEDAKSSDDSPDVDDEEDVDLGDDDDDDTFLADDDEEDDDDVADIIGVGEDDDES